MSVSTARKLAFISKLLSIRKQENNEKTKRNCQENELCRFVFSAVLNSRSYSVHSRALIRYLQWNDSLFMNHRWLLCDVSQDLWVRFPFHLACQSVSDTAASLLLSDQFRPVSSQSVCSCLGQALLVYIFLFPLTGCTLGNPWQSQRLTGIQEQLQTGRMCESQAVWMESRSTDQSTSPDAFGTHKLRDGRCPNFLKREQIWTSRSQRTFLTSSWHNRFKYISQNSSVLPTPLFWTFDSCEIQCETIGSGNIAYRFFSNCFCSATEPLL